MYQSLIDTYCLRFGTMAKARARFLTGTQILQVHPRTKVSFRPFERPCFAVGDAEVNRSEEQGKSRCRVRTGTPQSTSGIHWHDSGRTGRPRGGPEAFISPDLRCRDLALYCLSRLYKPRKNDLHAEVPQSLPYSICTRHSHLNGMCKNQTETPEML
jgi:hypothetical protein